jgi:glycosyltransferase involved in cell wall biosynthesis
MSADRLLLRPSPDSSVGLRDFLVREHGFVDLVRAKTAKPIRPRWHTYTDLVAFALFILRHLRLIRQARTIYAVRYLALPLKLFSKLGLVRYQRLFWHDFNVKSAPWLRVFHVLSKLDSDRDFYVVRGESEATLYAEVLNLPRSRFVVLPFGDWEATPYARSPRSAKADAGAAVDGVPYYFSGGYSNRDYASLIRAFTKVPQKLIIVSSFLNGDLDDVAVPDNVKVLRDVPFAEFDRLLRGATACIFPLKYNLSGGQSVLVHGMKLQKPIIVSENSVMREYIRDAKAAVFVKDIEREIPQVVRQLESDPQRRASLARAASEQYDRHLSRKALSARLTSILQAPQIAAQAAAQAAAARGAVPSPAQPEQRQAAQKRSGRAA